MKKIALLLIVASLSNCTQKETEAAQQIDIDHGIHCRPETRTAISSIETLPVSIDQELVDYLNLENGAPKNAVLLKTSDLNYKGIYTACGQPIKIWQYPCDDKKGCWVAVQPWKDTYLKTTIGVDPKGLLLWK